MKTIFSVCWRIGSIFQILPLTVNQRPETVTLLPSGLVYLLLCFISKVSTHHLLDYLTFVYFWSERIDVFGKFLLCFYVQKTYGRSIVTGVVSSHKCLTYTNQILCTMSFNRKLIMFLGGGGEYFETEGPWFVLFLRGRRADFKARAILVLRLRPANLLWGATLRLIMQKALTDF